MKIEMFPDPDAVARKGAEIVAAEARAAVKQRGRFMVRAIDDDNAKKNDDKADDSQQ